MPSFGSGLYGGGLYGGVGGGATLLSMCSQVASKIPVAAPTTIVNNPDETAMLLFACAQDEGDNLARYPQGGWIEMIREYDFTTAALQPQSGAVANTAPNGAAQITGLTSTAGIAPLTWYAFGQGLLNNSIVASVDSATQVTLTLPCAMPGEGLYSFGQSDYALPLDFERPVDGTFWDRSRFWSMRGPQSPQQWQLYKSSVIGRASIQRRFRFRNIGGVDVFSIDPVPTDNGSELVFEYVSNAWCASSAGIPQTYWQADSDTPILDSYLFRLGIQWRVLERLGLSYQSQQDEYERQRSKAAAQNGGAAILDMTPSNQLHLIGPFQIPETNFGGPAT